ncbi:MAG: ankyrin repeat domain-containing protein [Candidatus Micrarchaeota archaeon]|nr:ankyrin repeat domain-containing protein [Candidatus Micrarchaeota archaeon]
MSRYLLVLQERLRSGKDIDIPWRRVNKELDFYRRKVKFKVPKVAKSLIYHYYSSPTPSALSYIPWGPKRDILKEHLPTPLVVGKGTLLDIYALFYLDLLDPNFQEKSLHNTALHVAVTTNNLRALEILLRYGAQNLPNKNGITPLDWAKLLGREEAYHILAHHFKTLNEEIKT